jgi:hypothetical protein
MKQNLRPCCILEEYSEEEPPGFETRNLDAQQKNAFSKKRLIILT